MIGAARWTVQAALTASVPQQSIKIVQSPNAFWSRSPRARFFLRLAFSERPAADALDVDVDALCVRFW